MRTTHLLPLLLGAALSVGACTATQVGEGSSDVTSGIAVTGESPMFPGFSYDTGLLPKVSPAQVSFKAKAEGALRMSAAAHRAGEKLEGNKGSGKLAIDLHAKLEGRLKVTSTFKSYDGEIPGLKDVDIAATAEAPFDPFLLGEGEEVEAIANVPETKLPDVPLSGVPGHLELTVKEGTTVKAKLHGSCLRGAESKASYSGATTTSGTLVLNAKLVLDLPAPLDEAIDLPDISIDLPETSGALEAKSEAAGVPDFTAGTCSAEPGGKEGAPGTNESPKPSEPTECTDLANSAASVTGERVTGTEPVGAGGKIADGTYSLLSLRAYSYSGYEGVTFKRTIRISKGKLEVVTDMDGDVSRTSGVYVASGKTLSRSFSCPAPELTDAPQYTATPTSLTLIFPDHTVYTYGKQ